MTPDSASILDRRENGGDRREVAEMPSRSWVREQLTMSNIVILATALVGVGGYVAQVRQLDARVAKLEALRDSDAAVYQRKEIQAEQLRLIEWRLAGVEQSTQRIEAKLATRKE